MGSKYPDLRPAPTSGPQQRAFSPPLRRPRLTAIACDQCRRAKTKCDGIRPSCSRCRRTGQICVYTGAADETPTAALKRTARYYEEKSAELEELYQHLRFRPEPEAIEILRRLRSSANPSDVLQLIDHGDLMIQRFSSSSRAYDVNITSSPSSTQVQLASTYPNVFLLNLPTWLDTGDQTFSPTWMNSQGTAGDTEKLLSIKEMSWRMKHVSRLYQPLKMDFDRLPDERLLKASCHPWTSIIMDDQLFRILISVYLTWIHPTYTVLDADCFVDDLINQRTRFCSPMLVNAMLSVSYFHYVLLITPRGTRANTSLGFAFVKEARRLYNLHEGSQTLTMLQAMILTAFTYNCIGRDKVGFTLFGSALAMATDMGLTSNNKARDGDHMMFYVEQTTIWGLFHLLNITCFKLRKQALFRSPPTGPVPADIKKVSREGVLHSWTPYPYMQFARPVYLHDMCNASVEFWKIAKEIIACLNLYSHDPESHPSLSEAEDFYSRLLAWSQTFPGSLRLQELSAPFVLILHSWFHIVVIELFRPFTEQGFNKPLPSATLDSRVDTVVGESIRQLRILTIMMAIRFDCRLIPLSLPQSALTLCFDTRKDLDDDESARIFAICFNILYGYSHSLPYFDYMLQLLKGSIKRTYNDVLPPIIEVTFRDAPELKPTNHSHEEVQSSFPIDLEKVIRELEETSLDNPQRYWQDGVSDGVADGVAGPSR